MNDLRLIGMSIESSRTFPNHTPVGLVIEKRRRHRLAGKDAPLDARCSLINNTDIVMKGVHLYVVCEEEHPRSHQNALSSKFDLPPGTIFSKEMTETADCVWEVRFSTIQCIETFWTSTTGRS